MTPEEAYAYDLPTSADPGSQTRGFFISLVCVLAGFGLLMVYSASVTSWPTEYERVYFSRHLLYLLIGVSAAGVCALLPEQFWFRISPLLFLGCVILLILVLTPGIGTEVNGARRWLRLAGFSFQPSELAKIALPLFLCRLLASRRDQGSKQSAVDSRQLAGGGTLIPHPSSLIPHPSSGRSLPVVWPVLVVVPLVLVQPDLGTALFLAGGGALALFIGGWPLRNFVLCALCGVPVCYWGVSLKPYQMQRITGFLDSWSDWTQAPYQLKQSLLALGSGGLFGAGLGKGWQKLGFVPEANTDFVVAVVGEEFGLVGTLALAACWAALYVAGVRLLCRFERSEFAAVAGLTLLTQIVLQAALNMAIVIGMVPPKGIPHPLLSYGGSNLVVTLAALGIILSLSRSSKAESDLSAIG